MDKKLFGKEWTVRLRGGEGGWRGNQNFIGKIRFEDGNAPQMHIQGLDALTDKASLPVLAARENLNTGEISVEVGSPFAGGRWLRFELHRQHYAELGIGAFASQLPAQPPAPSVAKLNPNMKFRARLCGQNGGGWKGDQKFVGVMRFHPPLGPQSALRSISFEAGFEGHPAAGKSFEIEERSAVLDGRFEVRLRQFPCLDENDEGEEVIHHRAEELIVEIHLEDVAKATITTAGSESETSAANAVLTYAKEQQAEEVKPVMVPYNPSGEEQAQVAFYENILNNQSALNARQHVRAMALAMLRHVAQNPGRSVAFDMQAASMHVTASSVVPNDRHVRTAVIHFAKSTGLLPFLILERDTMRVCEKSVVKDGYAYAKGIEPFLLPVDKMQISLPATVYAVEAPIQMDKAMQEALELTRRVNQG